MTNGQEKGGENYQAFIAWVAAKTDSDLREIVLHGEEKDRRTEKMR